jgi:hypothetical protein
MRGRRRRFVRSKSTRGRWMQMDGSRLTDRVAAQVGCSFPGPGPRMNPRVHAERAVRERADGPFSFSGQIAAWRVERRFCFRAGFEL